MSRGVLLDPITGRPLLSDDGVLTLDAIRMDDPDRREKLDEIRRTLSLAKDKPWLKALTRNKYYAGVRTAATAATLRIQACICWNPHSTSRISCFEVWLANTAAVAYNLSMTRATARGTASTTSTPGINNGIANDSAPPSGFVVDTAWSVAPTISAVDMIRWNIPGVIGAGVILPFPDPIDLPPVTGLALIAATATIFQPSDVTWVIGD